MTAKFTVKDFFKRFPDDNSCLAHIMDVRFGSRHNCKKCQQDSTFHKIADRKAFACANCGDHVYPCAGTIFQDSSTSLQTWFYAIYLFVVTRHGVSGKELQRTLGVTYKTAHRMGHKVRELMSKADEMYVGGKRKGKRGRGADGKTIVMGLKEREGRFVAEVIADVKMDTMQEVVNRNVQTGSIVSTDEFRSYNLLTNDGYKHGVVQHGIKEYALYDAENDVLHHTNTVENFWKLFKSSVKSTHIHVSSKYMDRYLKEFTFRSNHRLMGNAMFDLLIGAV